MQNEKDYNYSLPAIRFRPSSVDEAPAYLADPLFSDCTVPIVYYRCGVWLAACLPAAWLLPALAMGWHACLLCVCVRAWAALTATAAASTAHCRQASAPAPAACLSARPSHQAI